MTGPDIVSIAVFIALVGLIAFAGLRVFERRVELQTGDAKDAHPPSPYPRIWRRQDVALLTHQLRAVASASFQRRRLLNRSEFRVFATIEADLAAAKKGYRVFAQVSLGEIIDSKNHDAFFAINSKRVDILIVDRAGWPVVAVEYQGGGHFKGTAEARDAIKDNALRKAGIGFVEIFERDSAEQIRARVREHLGWETQTAEPESRFSST